MWPCIGGSLPYGSPAYLSYLSLLTSAAAAAAAGGQPGAPQLVPASPFPSPSSAGCCTPVTRLDVSPSSSALDFSSPFQPPPPSTTTQRLLDVHKGLLLVVEMRTVVIHDPAVCAMQKRLSGSTSSTKNLAFQEIIPGHHHVLTL